MPHLVYVDGGAAKVLSAFRSNSRLWYRIAAVVTLSLSNAAISDSNAAQGLILDELSNQIFAAIPDSLKAERAANIIVIRSELQHLLESEKHFIVRM